MTRAFAAGLACLFLIAFPARAGTGPAPLPFVQGWSDSGQISIDDDWTRVHGIVGYRGDGLAAEPGIDPRSVTADGSGTPLDVSANLTDPRAVGLAAGVAEFELPDPVVAIQGSATASAPHLSMSLDTRGRAGMTVRLLLRDIDATPHDAVEPVAVQFRVGAAGAFAAVPGGYVADATSGPSEATQVTRVSVNLPAAADGQPLVQVRVITTNAVGQDEWIGVDDIEVSAAAANGGETGGCPAPGPAPTRNAPELTGLELAPATFMPAKRGPAIVRRGRAGAALRFRLSRPALVRFELVQGGGTPEDFAPKRWLGRTPSSGRRFSVRGRRGLNRLRFSGRVRGRPLAPGAYVLQALAVDRAGLTSAPAAVRFRIARPED